MQQFREVMKEGAQKKASPRKKFRKRGLVSEELVPESKLIIK